MSEDLDVLHLIKTSAGTMSPGAPDCSQLIAERDWSHSSLGPSDQWSSSLRTTVGLVLASKIPMVLLWGDDGVMIYNDAYSVFAGGRHPDLLGMKVREGWPEVAEFNDNVMKTGLAGETLSYKDQVLTLHRHGVPEKVSMNLDYSPVPGDDGAPGGVLAIVVETTERRLAERAASEASRRLELALNAGAIVGTWVWDVSADVFQADERFAASFDIDPDHCQAGLPLSAVIDSIHADDRERVIKTIDEALKDKDMYRCDYRVRRADGSYGWISASGRVERDEKGNPTRFPGVLVDINEQKRAEDLRALQTRLLELAVTDAPLETLLEMLIDTVEAVSATGMLGSILLLDPDERHLRHGAGPSLPKPYIDAIDGIEIGPRVGSCGTAAHTREPVYVADITTDPLWSDFKDLALPHGLRACWSIPLFASDAKLLGTFAMYYPEPREPVSSDLEIVDFVTRAASLVIERKLSEETLREVSSRLDAVLNNTTMAVFVIDERHECIFANNAAEQLTGFTFAELQHGPLHDVIHHKKPDGSHYPMHECPIDRAFPMGDQVQGEELFVHKDGSFYPVAFTASPIRDQASKTIGTIIEVRNISAEKELDAELADALQAKEILLHEVNHRVKNSLQVVTSLLMLQAGLSNDPALRQSLMEARGRISVVAAMHQRLYSTSQHDRVDFGEYVEELATDTVASLGSSSQIRLETKIEPGITVILQHAVAMALVVTELVTNALKYAFPDGREGVISVQLLQSGENLVIEVSDDGVGLPQDFDPNRRGGIGMRIVTSLVKQLRGELQIEANTPGTRFRINLPAAQIS